jgi:hypothetical protein
MVEIPSGKPGKLHLAREYWWHAKLRQFADVPPNGSVVPIAALVRFFTQAIGAGSLRVMGRGGETKSVAASGVMIELAQCDSHLPGKINKRYREGTEGNHEQDGHPALMLNLE